MVRTIKMDQAGRVVIPQSVRERYGLGGGSHRLEIVESPEGIVLRPKTEEIPAERDSSGWVFFRSSAEEPVDPVDAVDRERGRRQQRLRGNE